MTVRGFALVFLQFALLGMLIVIPGNAAPEYSSEIAGLLYSCAVLLAAPAVINLRPSLTAMPEPKNEAPLITHGIYRLIRHPMYTALLCLASGLAITRWTPLAAVLLLSLIAVLLQKARYEDRLLQQRWPEAMDYQRRTGAFLPRLPRR